MSSKPEIDNSWFERGELPPVGTVCEVMRNMEWTAVEILKTRVNSSGIKVAAAMDAKDFTVFWSNEFRPLRTEREKTVDEMANLIARSVFGSAKCQAEKLYDAGYRMVKP